MKLDHNHCMKSVARCHKSSFFWNKWCTSGDKHETIVKIAEPSLWDGPPHLWDLYSHYPFSYGIGVSMISIPFLFGGPYQFQWAPRNHRVVQVGIWQPAALKEGALEEGKSLTKFKARRGRWRVVAWHDGDSEEGENWKRGCACMFE